MIKRLLIIVLRRWNDSHLKFKQFQRQERIASSRPRLPSAGFIPFFPVGTASGTKNSTTANTHHLPLHKSKASIHLILRYPQLTHCDNQKKKIIHNLFPYSTFCKQYPVYPSKRSTRNKSLFQCVILWQLSFSMMLGGLNRYPKTMLQFFLSITLRSIGNKTWYVISEASRKIE